MRDTNRWTRRELLHTSATVAVAGRAHWVLPRERLHEMADQSRVDRTPLRDPKVKALALQAVDVARSAGARYADVRLTQTANRTYEEWGPDETVTLGISVRALVDGYWGWAARPDLTAAAASWVGQEAVRLATANAARRTPRDVDLGTISPVQNGDWTTPITIDPFDVAVQECEDWLFGLRDYIGDLASKRGHQNGSGAIVGKAPASLYLSFLKQDRVFASTEGSFITQTIYHTKPQIRFRYRGRLADAEPRDTVQAGYEYVLDQHYRERVRQEMDRIDVELARNLRVKPFEVGRYDVVCSARAMTELLDGTLGPAMELDRALGYEANAGGTSYLGPDPFRVLGTPIASSLVTITANRSMPLGLATLRWDDEGVAPDDFLLVKDGVLVDYQTTREQAAWLAPWYQKRNQPLRSHGCAMAPTGLEVTMQHTPNLVLHPGATGMDIETLIANMEHGILVDDLGIDMDFQQLNGLGFSNGATEVRNGRRVASLTGTMALSFHTPELWNSITALGDATGQLLRGGFDSRKGDPQQTTQYSIAAVPAMIKQIAVVDPLKKA